MVTLRLFLCSFLFIFTFTESAAQSATSARAISYEYVLSSLEPDFGYGLETTGIGPIHQPMAYALVASAAANRGDEKSARQAADWLVININPERAGWGLGWDWDAFSNGTINPANTVYGITTALAVDGLVNTYCLTKESQYLEVATQALEYYSQFQSLPTGHISYSNQPADSTYVVPNITAMLMGQYARVGQMTMNQRFIEVAQIAYQAMLKDAVREKGALKYIYAYGVANVRENDLVHTAYITYGLYLYEKYMTSHQSLTSCSVRHLTGFIGDDVYEYNTDRSSKIGDRKARGWGIGMALFLASLLNEKELFQEIFSYLKYYEFDNQRFSYLRGDRLHSPRVVAHVLLGLSLFDEGGFTPVACR